MTMPSHVFELSERVGYVLDNSATVGPDALPMLDVAAIALEMIVSCIDDISRGAGRAPRSGPGWRNCKRALEVSIAWLNEGDAVLAFDVACATLNTDPVRVRKAIANEIGLNSTPKKHFIRGPFDAEHAQRAREMVLRVGGLKKLDLAPADGS